MSSTIQSLLCEAETRIPRFEAELLLAHTLKKNRSFVLAHPEYSTTQEERYQFDAFVTRRTEHEPVAFLVGRKEFYGREFLVNEHTLIPRPETELLVEKILEHISNIENGFQAPRLENRSIVIIDIGTGSGNIITTIATELSSRENHEKHFSFIGTDISKDALDIAKKNSEKLSVSDKIRFIQSDLLENIPKEFFSRAQESIIAANLPYLSTEEFSNVPVDVKHFEPRSALESGVDGLDHYRKLLEELRKIFQRQKRNSKTTLFFEISPSQKSQISSLIQAIFPRANSEIFRDLAQKYRLVKISIDRI